MAFVCSLMLTLMCHATAHRGRVRLLTRCSLSTGWTSTWKDSVSPQRFKQTSVWWQNTMDLKFILIPVQKDYFIPFITLGNQKLQQLTEIL